MTTALAERPGRHSVADLTRRDFQGFMEGGAETGQQTAKDLAKLLK